MRVKRRTATNVHRDEPGLGIRLERQDADTEHGNARKRPVREPADLDRARRFAELVERNLERLLGGLCVAEPVGSMQIDKEVPSRNLSARSSRNRYGRIAHIRRDITVIFLLGGA